MGCGTSRCAENPVANLAVGAYASARDNDVEGVRAALEVMDVDTPDAVRGPAPRRTPGAARRPLAPLSGACQRGMPPRRGRAAALAAVLAAWADAACVAGPASTERLDAAAPCGCDQQRGSGAHAGQVRRRRVGHDQGGACDALRLRQLSQPAPLRWDGTNAREPDARAPARPPQSGQTPLDLSRSEDMRDVLRSGDPGACRTLDVLRPGSSAVLAGRVAPSGRGARARALRRAPCRRRSAGRVLGVSHNGCTT